MTAALVMPPVDRILVDRAPGQTRILLCAGDPAGDGRVVETLFSRCGFSNLIGSIHRVRLAVRQKVQNRALATLHDGTAVSIRLGRQDRAVDGDLATITVTAAPREGKPWQAVMGAKLVGRTLILLPEQSGVSTSRHFPRSASDLLMGMLSERLRAEDAEYGVILRREAAHAEVDAVMAELDGLLADWANRDKAPDGACLHDGGDLASRAMRLAPDARLLETESLDHAAQFDEAWDGAIDIATRQDVDLPGGGILWIESTRAVTALDLDSAAGTLETLLRDAPQAIAAHLRLRATGGLVVIDVPRAASGAMKRFWSCLGDALAADPRHPDRLGRTAGGLLEVRLPHGQPGPADYGRDDVAVTALAALREISWRPQLARPHLYAPQPVIDWLRGVGSGALADLADRLDRQLVLGVSSQGLVIRDGPQE